MHSWLAALNVAFQIDAQVFREMLYALLRHLPQQLPRALAAHGIDALRRDFRQWHQHKGAFRHAWVRDRQVVLLYMQIIIKDDVDVDGTRPIAERGLPTQRLLYLFDRWQQFLRRKRGLPAQHYIQKKR